MKEHEGMYQIERITKTTEYFLINKEEFTGMENLGNFDVVRRNIEYTSNIMDYDVDVLGAYLLPLEKDETFNMLLQDLLKYCGVDSDFVSIKVVSDFEDTYYKAVSLKELKETIREILLDKMLPLEDAPILRDSTGTYLKASYGQCWSNSIRQPGHEHYTKIYLKNLMW